MKQTIIKACVAVLVMFSITQLIEPLPHYEKTYVQPEWYMNKTPIVIIEVPVREQKIIEEDMSPRIVIVDNSDMVYEDIDVFCLAKNIFHEAGIEPDIGKYSVAQVTINRVASRKYPDSICKVVLQRYQFSWANQRSRHWTHPKGPNWDRSYQIAQDVMDSGYRVKGLENVRYYHADYVKPHWSRKMTHVSTIGRHVFYTNDVIY
jgi:spore germination cell wall hydrolase CwlJ-like protein